MGFFSRKSKSKSKNAAAAQDANPAEEQKPKAAYRHVPTHAAADSAGQGGRVDSNQERERIAVASKNRLRNSIYDSTLGNASQTQMIAHEMAHGTPSPSGPASLASRRSRSLSRHQSGVSFMDANAPPLPTASSARAASAGGRAHMHRYSSDYFSQLRMSTYENAASEFEKSQNKDASAQPAYNYPDSGYASGMNSQAPSLLNLPDESKLFLQRNHSGFLPELNVDGDTLQQQISRENSSLQSRAQDHMPEPKSIVAVGDNLGNTSPVDAESDSRSVKSNRSSGSVTKRTRFGDIPDPMPSLDRLHYHRDRSLTPPRRDNDNSAQQYPSHQKTEKPYLPPLEAISARPSSRRATLPPLSILAGLKVNKRGRILDEEGEAIGELVEGELLDCVRLKANANGEVIDEYGRTVGMVRTIAGKRSLERSSSSAMGLPEVERTPISPRARDSPPTYQPTRTASPTEVYSSLPEVVSPLVENDDLVAPALSPQEAEHYFEVPASPTKEDGLSGQQVSRAEDQTAQTSTTSIDFATQDAPRRSPRLGMDRRSMELPRPSARLTMSSVPEDNVAEERPVPCDPSAFTYKGDIPADDSAQLAARSQVASLAEMRPPRLLPVGIHPQSAIYSQTPPNLRGVDMMTRRNTTQFTGAYTAMNLNSRPRQSVAFPQRPSPLSSQGSCRDLHSVVARR